MRREETETLRSVIRMNVGRRRGRLKKRWFDTIDKDVRTADMCVGNVEDCDKSMSKLKVTDSIYLGRR